MRFVTMIVVIVSILICSPAVFAETARAVLKDANGKQVGNVTLTELPHGVLIKTDLFNILPGIHAFHIHSVGECKPPFKSAGGHFNPEGKAHGLLNGKGPHAGDLPNIYVGTDGKLTFEVIADKVTLKKGMNSLHDKDGSAIVIHAGADDYVSDPAGNAGPRIACGIIR